LLTPAADSTSTDERVGEAELNNALPRRLAAEALGTGALVAAVVGSGIMATKLTDDVAVQLLFNAASTVAALGVLIYCLAPVSGAHFNPAVTAAELAQRRISASHASGYVVAQVAGGVLGAAVADLMFDLPAWTLSTTERSSSGVWLGELVATAGLILIIATLTRGPFTHARAVNVGAILIPAWIGAAYLFTSSTSFANPAVTIARSLTDTFSGIAPDDVLAFIAFQLIGAAVGWSVALLLYPSSKRLEKVG
jgi:arsenate reductase